MENQHEKIKGYRDLTQDEIDKMNQLKSLEDRIAATLGQMEDMRLDCPALYDVRALAIAKIKFQEGFMWAIRAVAKPESKWE